MSDTVLHAETHSAVDRQCWDPPSPAALEAMLSDYTVERLIGCGGMGAVYRARQISLNRPVALKIIADDLDEAEDNYSERFKNEARAMARLSHPGIVAVYDFGQTGGGLLYIGMEYIEGTDVARMLLQQERLLPKHALAITAQVCTALACAHERGIIHRDIKPANIMVTPDDVVKVADFGLAKVHDSDGQTLGLTQSGFAMGTLHYMAPETLILGTAVDHRADIYAVGVMLYQMITGKVPHGMFKPPSQQMPGLDPRYDAMITKAMRADRDRRYQTIQELHRDLCDILTGGTLKVEPEEPPASAAVPARTLRQVFAETKSRVFEHVVGLKFGLPSLFAKVRPLARSAVGWGSVALLVVLFLGVIAFGGYAFLTVAEKISPHQPLESQTAPRPPPATAPLPRPAPPQAAPIPAAPAAPSPAPMPAEKLAAVPAAAPMPAATIPASQKLAVQPGETRPPATANTPPQQAFVTAVSPVVTKPADNDSPRSAPVLKKDPRLAKLEAAFDKFWREEMQQPYLAELNDLRKRYVDTGLTQARDKAQKFRRESELRALDAEIALVQSGAAIPAANESGNAPASLINLRRLYHDRLSEYTAGRARMAPPVLRAQLKGFDAYIKELKDAGRTEDAMRVQAVRDSKAELKLE